MYFTSSAFVLFLIVILAAYFLFPDRIRPIVLPASCLLFYGFSGWRPLVCILVTSVSVWYVGLRMDLLAERVDAAAKDERQKALRRDTKIKKRRWLILGLCLNLGILAIMKYTGFVTGNINDLLRLLGFAPSVKELSFILPMGISFYTFKAASYIIDVYRSKTAGAADRNLMHVALFVSFFPAIVQGPISRFGDMRKTLFLARGFRSEQFFLGLRRTLWGFFKKLVVADRLLPAVTVLTLSPEDFRGVYVLMAMWFYAIALYADFTGGIDIAIGVAQMLGVEVAENFDRPFYSKSIFEYWRRWHITMGTWFKDYLFYPLSTSRFMLRMIKPAKRIFGDRIGVRIPVYLVTLILWFATGLWHGASRNFIVWGMLNGVVIVISQELTPLYKRFHVAHPFSNTPVYNAFQIVRTFCLMSFIRTFDIYDSVSATLRAYASIPTDFRFSLNALWENGLSQLGLSGYDYAVVACGVLAMISVGVWMKRRDARKRISDAVCFTQCWFIFFVIALFGCYGIGYDAQQFIYNRF